MARQGVDPEEALKLARLIEELGRVDLDKIKVEALSPLELLAHELETNGKFQRRVAGAKKPKPRRKIHWSTARARRRKYQRDYYHSVLKPATLRKRASMLRTPEGWWEHQTHLWRVRKQEYTITREEFLEIVWPALGGEVPVFHRYNPNLPFSLDNLVVYKNRSKQVLFDGKEYELKRLGYVL